MRKKSLKKAVPPSSESDFLILWKMGYAHESFKYVRATCDYIIAERLDRHSPAFVPLCVALIVLYARPFRRSRVIGTIPERMVPRERRFLHNQLLTLRDQVAAHMDADALGHGAGGLPANNVRMIIQNDGSQALGIYELKFTPDAIIQIRQLADILVTKTIYHVDRICKKMHRMMPVAPGEYLLDLGSETFRKIEPSPDEKGRN